MADAAVWITGSGPDKQLNFRLPTGGKGDKGDKGDKGADGANVLPTDTAIRDAIANPASATRGALNAAVIEQADPAFARTPVTDLFPTIASMVKATTQASWIWTMGDSKSEGYGATSEANRYTRKLLAKLRAKYPSGATGGIDFIPARFNLTEPAWTPQWTFSGSTANVGVGIAHRGTQLVYHATTPGTASLTFTGTGIDLLFWRLSTDTIEYRVDAGTWTSYVLPTNVKYAQRQVTGLTAGSHTVEVRNSGASGSGPVLVGGVVYNGDAANSVHVMDCSISGGKMSGFVSVAGDTSGTIQNKQSWSEYLAYYPPKLLVISMGTNDVVTDTSAQYETNVRAAITLARSKVANTPVLLIVPEEPSDRTLIEPWANYTAALRKISDDTSGVKFYDTARRFPKQGSGNPNGTYIDAVHYNDAFQDYWAQLVFEAITTDAT